MILMGSEFQDTLLNLPPHLSHYFPWLPVTKDIVLYHIIENAWKIKYSFRNDDCRQVHGFFVKSIGGLEVNI